MKSIYYAKVVWIASTADLIFLLLVALIPVMNIVGWWKLVRTEAAFKSWRKMLSFAGLLANAFVILAPFMIVLSPPLRRFDWNSILIGVLSLCAFSLVASIAGLKQVRMPLLISTIGVAILYLMIPIGIL